MAEVGFQREESIRCWKPVFSPITRPSIPGDCFITRITLFAESTCRRCCGIRIRIQGNRLRALSFGQRNESRCFLQRLSSFTMTVLRFVDGAAEALFAG